MKKTITLISLLFFIFAPLVVANNSAIDMPARSALHHLSSESPCADEPCAGEAKCVNTVQQCCLSGASVTFYEQTFTSLYYLGVFQRSAYVCFNLQPLIGLKSARYRPPIV
ncbi:MAG: hypothetical protein V5786_10805 [Psychromonas sp.]